MKIAFVSPSFPPRGCGVGDHGACLALALDQLGNEVTVFSADEPKAEHPRVRVKRIERPWRQGGYELAVQRIAESGARVVLVQFTPFLFKSPGWDAGIAFPRFLRSLREAGLRVGLIAHELNYPVGISPRGLLLGFPQWIQFRRAFAEADHVFFTNDGFARRFSKANASKVSWTPVGPSLTGLAKSPWADPGTGGAFDPSDPLWGKPKLLLHFGGAHPTHLLDHAFEAYRSARAKWGAEQVGMGLVGVRADQVPGGLPDGVRALGYLSVDAAIRAISTATLVLAPFMDGISVRRSSVMAVLALGKPVLTNRGWLSDSNVDWDAFCLVASDRPDAGAFAAAALRALEDPAGTARMGERGRAELESRFSWLEIARRVTAPWKGVAE